MEDAVSYGQKIMTKYETYRMADTALADALLRTQNHWRIIEVEMQVFRDLSQRLDEKLQLHLAHMFQKLHIKLQEAVAALDSVLGDEKEPKAFDLDHVLRKKGNINRLKLASNVKGALDKILVEMDHWHSLLQPFLFLLVRVKDPSIDHQLSCWESNKSDQIGKLKQLRGAIHRKETHKAGIFPIFIADDQWMEGRSPILYTTGELAKDSTTKSQLYIEYFTPHTRTPSRLATTNVRDLGRVLSVVDPLLFFILACRGIIKSLNPSGSIKNFQLVFQIPNSLHHPRSFREVLLTTNRYPLDICFQFAKQLARGVMFVHTTNFVHKNLRPETILVLQEENTSTSIGLPFLVGFQSFRPADGATYLNGDAEWQKDLYRHPSRQGILPEDWYDMQHDIYSLGVCLLELGIWESFIIPSGAPNGEGDVRPNPNLNISSHLTREWADKAQYIKQELMALAKERLPSLMGPRYTRIVSMCLSCLDTENNDFGHESEFLDLDGVLVGVRYIEKVCD